MISPDHATERNGPQSLAPDGRITENTDNGDSPQMTATQDPPVCATAERTPSSSGKRDYRLDFLRGIAVLIMVIDHVAGPSPLHLLTGGNGFFVSAAEGFVFISGFLVGIVYGGKVRRLG